MRAKFITRAAVVAVAALIFSAAAHAVTLNLAAGTLQPGTKNNEFLLAFDLTGTGLETPVIYDNYGNFASANMAYQQSTNPTFIFDYSFFVAEESIISENTTYSDSVGSATSSVSLLQGNSVIDTGIQTGPDFGENYSLPSVTLEPNTQYDLVITTLGVPTYTGSPYSQGWGQVSVDVSAVPEPTTIGLFAVPLLARLSLRRRTYSASGASPTTA